MKGHRRAQELNDDSSVHFFYECAPAYIPNVTMNMEQILVSWLLSRLVEALLNEIVEPYKEWTLFQICHCFKNLHGRENILAEQALCVWVAMYGYRSLPSTRLCYFRLCMVTSLFPRMLKYTRWILSLKREKGFKFWFWYHQYVCIFLYVCMSLFLVLEIRKWLQYWSHLL